MKKSGMFYKHSLIFLKIFCIPIVIVLQGQIVYVIFEIPYPCTERCIGCQSWNEFLLDTWPSLYFSFSCLCALLLIFHSIGTVAKSDNTKETQNATDSTKKRF